MCPPNYRSSAAPEENQINKEYFALKFDNLFFLTTYKVEGYNSILK